MSIFIYTNLFLYILIFLKSNVLFAYCSCCCPSLSINNSDYIEKYKSDTRLYEFPIKKSNKICYEILNIKDLEKKIDDIYEAIKSLTLEKIENVYSHVLKTLKNYFFLYKDNIINCDIYNFKPYCDNYIIGRLSKEYKKKLTDCVRIINMLRNLKNLKNLYYFLIYREREFNITNLKGSFYSKEFYSAKMSQCGENSSRILLVSYSELENIKKIFSKSTVDVKKFSIRFKEFKYRFDDFKKNVSNDIAELGNILLYIYSQIMNDKEFLRILKFVEDNNSINNNYLLNEMVCITKEFFTCFNDKKKITEDILEELKKEGKIDENNCFNLTKK